VPAGDFLFPLNQVSLVVMYASRFRECVCTERNRMGGTRKKWGSQKSRATLRREVHAAQEVLKPRVRAQGVQFWIYFEPNQPTTVLLIGFFEPSEGLLFLT